MAGKMVQQAASGFFDTPDGKTIEIRDVWASNLEEEMANIREILEDYPYVAMVSVLAAGILQGQTLIIAEPRYRAVTNRVLISSCSVNQLGHRVPRCRGEANRRLCWKRRDIPHTASKRRYAEADSAWIVLH